MTLEAAGRDPKVEEIAKKHCEYVWLGSEETLSVHLAQIEPVEGSKRCCQRSGRQAVPGSGPCWSTSLPRGRDRTDDQALCRPSEVDLRQWG